ncbi:MAG: LON peptidase substrate-binding domain-containing protein [Candidatus Lindowbacteria bacterium]|nr:LON peptidase substrate-binding domain-containing protein [Candidatus Lindowbacteria bacterium]
MNFEPEDLGNNPHLLPLFPLPNLVLFPGCFLPLHIFEARFRALVKDVRKSSNLLVLALLKPGWEPYYHKSPPIYDTACVANISAIERLADGRFNILLEGVDRVKILDEVRERQVEDGRVLPYREVVTTVLHDNDSINSSERQKVLTLLSDVVSYAPVEIPDGMISKLSHIMGDGLLADTIANILQISVEEKQTILETNVIPDRYRKVAQRLEEIRARFGNT